MYFFLIVILPLAVTLAVQSVLCRKVKKDILRHAALIFPLMFIGIGAAVLFAYSGGDFGGLGAISAFLFFAAALCAAGGYGVAWLAFSVMKKKNRGVLLLLAVMLLLSGCEASSPIDAGAEGDSAGEPVGMAGDISETEAPRQEAASDGGRGEGATDSRYTWQEITITLPRGWEDRCVIAEAEDGFSIYQKASYEENNELGYICGFCRTSELLNRGTGESMFAYTEDGIFYYMMQPTDVACDTEKEEILNEYLEMYGQTAELKASVQIAVPGIHCDAEEYVLPTSSIFPLTQDMLTNLSDNDLWIARNEIYARHGRQFNNSYLQYYFNRCTWYEATTPAEQFEESALSQTERDNIKLLTAAEQEYDRQHPYPGKCDASETAEVDLDGDGTPDRISYQVSEQDNGEFQCLLTVNGETCDASELTYMIAPVEDTFYITDILESDGVLEIAVLDEGPSNDPVTSFFRYEDTLSYIGQVAGFPFAEENGGINGFDGVGNIVGRVRMDLIETTYLEGYWHYDGWVSYQTTAWHNFLPTNGHTLYTDLPVHYEMDETSATTVIPPQEVFFLGSDMYEWILVKGKDGSWGYMQVKDGRVVELNEPADRIFSDLYYFD